MLFAVLFAVAYFVMRSLPVTPCDFLHEETYNAEGIVDYCGGGDLAFVDLLASQMAFVFRFSPAWRIGPWQALRVSSRYYAIRRLSPHLRRGCASVIQKIHLLAVDESLSDYHHAPSTRLYQWGCLVLSFLTPKRAGKYAIFLDFIPIRSPRRVLLTSSFEVDGEQVEKPSVRENLSFSSGNRFFELKKDDSGDEIRLVFHASDQNGNTLGFQPVMGAFAHMVAFDGDLERFRRFAP